MQARINPTMHECNAVMCKLNVPNSGIQKEDFQYAWYNYHYCSSAEKNLEYYLYSWFHQKCKYSTIDGMEVIDPNYEKEQHKSGCRNDHEEVELNWDYLDLTN